MRVISGYIGHLASRHSEVLADSSPVLTNSQAEELAKQTQTQAEVRDDTDPELAIPKTSVPNYQSIDKQATKTIETKRNYRNTKGTYLLLNLTNVVTANV